MSEFKLRDVGLLWLMSGWERGRGGIWPCKWLDLLVFYPCFDDRVRRQGPSGWWWLFGVWGGGTWMNASWTSRDDCLLMVQHGGERGRECESEHRRERENESLTSWFALIELTLLIKDKVWITLYRTTRTIEDNKPRRNLLDRKHHHVYFPRLALVYPTRSAIHSLQSGSPHSHTLTTVTNQHTHSLYHHTPCSLSHSAVPQTCVVVNSSSSTVIYSQVNVVLLV